MKSIFTTLKVCVILLFTQFINPEYVIAQSPPPSGWLYTNGNRIYISDGDNNKANDEVFAGRGANIFDTRSCGAGFWYKDVGEIKRRIDLLVDDWGANFMRLCLESRKSMESDWVHGLPFSRDNTGYLEDVVEIVEYIGTKPGVYVEVSLWAEPSTTEGGLPTKETNEEWKILAPALDKYKHVMFGICNEPHITDDAKVYAAMDSAVMAIRAEEAKTSYPQHIIAVQGTREYARDISYYVNNPVSGGVNIVYETHPYSDDFGRWFFNEQKTIPVLVGELGPAIINNKLYQKKENSKRLMDTCDVLKIPYAAWSFHMRCGVNTSMLVDNSNNGLGVNMKLEPTEWGEMFRDHLKGMKIGTKIRDIKVDPLLNYNNVDNNIRITALVYSATDQITSVTADLSEIGGGSNVAMTKNGVLYSCSQFIPSGFPADIKYFTITAKNSKDISVTEKARVLIKEPIESEMVIYRDNETKITEEEVGWERGTLSEVSGGAPEGNKQYKWDFYIKDWWGGFQLYLNNRQGVDFTGYKAIRFALRKVIKTGNPDELGMLFKLGDTEGKETGILKLTVTENLEYYTIPLDDMENVDMTSIEKLIYDGDPYNNKEYTGEFYLDDITLIPPNAGDLSVSPSSLTLEPIQGSQGNVSITTSKDWTASTTTGWISLSATSGSGDGSFTVTTNSVNASTSNRTGSVTISAGGLSKVVQVTQKWEDPLAVDPVSDKLVNMYPNPAGDKMRIEVPEMANVRIMNMQGASLITKRNILSSDIDISGLSKGIYLVKVEIGDKVLVRRLVKY